MKAILVIDMPMDCYDCPFHRSYLDRQMNERIYCSPMKKDIDGFNAKAEWCPLKLLPKKMIPVVIHQCIEDEYLYQKGWNDCLKEIEE